MEKPKDRDFIETVEGLIFCVVGYLHPPDGYTAYLKYIPDPSGKWNRKGTRYARAMAYYHVSQVEKTYDFLREQYPQYLLRCPVRNITISSVPASHVKNYYRPKARLQSVIKNGARDELERKLIDLASYLGEISGLEIDDFGVTGSILTGNHNPEFSDIDLTVHGIKATRRLRGSILDARKKGGEVQELSKEKMADWIESRSKRFPLSSKDLSMIAERRWNYGMFKGTYFSVHPIRTDDEINERYGDLTYRQRGTVKGSAKIRDASESIYLPAIYEVTDVCTGHEPDTGIEQIASYEGIFSDIFRENELVEFRGTLEEVIGDRNFFRIVIGGAGSPGDYMKLIG